MRIWRAEALQFRHPKSKFGDTSHFSALKVLLLDTHEFHVK